DVSIGGHGLGTLPAMRGGIRGGDDERGHRLGTLPAMRGGIRGGESHSCFFRDEGFLGFSSSAARIWSSCDERCAPSSSVSSGPPALAIGFGCGGFAGGGF